MGQTATQMLHTHMGTPAVDGCAAVVMAGDERCYVCGGTAARGMAVSKWQGTNFTGQDRALCPWSHHVCEACVWAMAGKPPDTMRMKSHLYEAGVGHAALHKGDKAAILAFLRQPHAGAWWAAIADSGKKHILPATPVNPAGASGRVRFEERTVALPARGEGGWSLVDDIAALLGDGVTKREVDAGSYSPRSYEAARARVEAFERRWRGSRGEAWFALALWLAQAVEGKLDAE